VGSVAGKAPVTEGEAWKRHPDAEDTAAACAGSKFVDGAARSFEDSSFISRVTNMDQFKFDAAKQSLAGLTDEEKKKLPNSAKVFVAERLPATRAGGDVRARVLDASRFDDMGYTSWQEERQVKMFKALDADPLVAEAQKRWNEPGFTEDDKMQAARRIHQIQMESFGGTPLPMRVQEDAQNHGIHSSRDRDIKISKSPRLGLNQPDFAEFVDTVTHESLHALQDQIAERDAALKAIDKSLLDDLKVKSVNELTPEGRAVYDAERARKIEAAFPGDPNSWNKELGENGRLASIVPMLRYQMKEGGYMPHSTAGIENYSANPVEVHAFGFGGKVGEFVKATPEERKDIIDRLETFSEMDKRIHDNRLEERKTTLPSTKPCV
jgi:hypothetical protein